MININGLINLKNYNIDVIMKTLEIKINETKNDLDHFNNVNYIMYIIFIKLLNKFL